MRRLRPFLCLAFCALLLAAGCSRDERSPYATETDEPGYQHGKALEKQGLAQAALGEYLKVIAKRGEDAPESHLDAGLIYEDRVKDPVAAIYHFRRYLELRPNSPQADLVRERIEACLRDFARTLPAQPFGTDGQPPDYAGNLARLQRENSALRADLAALRGGRDLPAAAPAATEDEAVLPPAPAAAPADRKTPVITRAPLISDANAHRPEPPSPAAAGRTHVIVPGDTLSSISERYYGTRSKWREIYAANRDVMKSEKDLKLGVKLRIP